MGTLPLHTVPTNFWWSELEWGCKDLSSRQSVGQSVALCSPVNTFVAVSVTVRHMSLANARARELYYERLRAQYREAISHLLNVLIPSLQVVNSRCVVPVVLRYVLAFLETEDATFPQGLRHQDICAITSVFPPDFLAQVDSYSDSPLFPHLLDIFESEADSLTREE